MKLPADFLLVFIHKYALMQSRNEAPLKLSKLMGSGEVDVLVKKITIHIYEGFSSTKT